MRPTPIGDSASPRRPPAIPDYDLLRCIGRGSYGDVWLARNVFGQFRAVKFLYRSRFPDPRPFEREFGGIQRFEPISRSHPSQLAILHVGKNDAEGCFYYVMELADDVQTQEETKSPLSGRDSGLRSPDSHALFVDTYIPRTLRLQLERHVRLPPTDCVRIGLSLATALAHLHQQGLVHRDIKPSNVIFVNGAAKLGDIGLVTDAGDTQSIVGTEGYLPPEGPGTPQADVYSLGKVLYEISTGMDRRRFAELPKDLPGWPDREAVFEFNEIVLKACAKDPAQRYSSSADLRADLELLQAGKSVRQARSWARWRGITGKVALALVAVAILLGIAIPRLTRKSRYASADGPPSTNELANALCAKALLNIRGDNFSAFAETFTNLHLALKLDPNCYRAYSGLLELRAAEFVPEIGTQTLEEMRLIAGKLHELGPNLAPTLVAQAVVKWSEWDYPASKQLAHQATKVNPDYGFGHLTYGFLLTHWGLIDEAHRELEIARRLVPSKVTLFRFLAHLCFVERDYTNATAIYRQALAWEPHHVVAFHFIGACCIGMNDYSNAILYLEKREISLGEEPLAVRTKYDALRRALKEGGVRGYWQEQWNRAGENELYRKAEIQCRLGNLDSAFAWLNKSYETHEQGDSFDSPLNYLVFDSVWDGLRDDPRFNELLDKVGFTKVNPGLRK